MTYSTFLRKLSLLCTAFIISITIDAQFNAEKEFLLISCKAGTLVIDGVEIGRIEAEDALKQKLGYGEHYLQVKTTAEKVNQTITVDSLTKSIIRIGCEQIGKSSSNTAQRLFSKQISLTGLIAAETDENLFAMDSGDELILNCEVLNKKGSVNIMIQELDRKTVIYQKERVNVVTNEKIRIPARGVYQLTLQTQALLGKDVQVTLDRMPGANSDPDFNTTVRKVYDTIPNPFLTTRGRVYSTTNSRPNKTIVPIQLPPNTDYWVYWIGLGEQSSNELKKMTDGLVSISKAFNPDPVTYFGLKLISELPMMKTPSTVNFYFMDTRNANAFMQGQQSYAYNDLPTGTHIYNAYNAQNIKKNDLKLVLANDSYHTGVDFELRAVAFTIKSRYVISE
ncbi:MAG: hypothetical protein DI535_23325 [Citrobacter freundii]|nr:MAG: hypothetical protein DI535_23325 [Citrobacter freundii]